MSDYYSEKPEFMVKIPTALRKFAVLLEPLRIVEKAIGQAWKIQQRLLWQPTRAVVLGAGPIGILCTILLRLRGLEVHVYAKSAPDSLQGRILNELGASYRSVDDHPVIGIKEVGVEMVRAGLARRQPGYDEKYGELAAAEDEARQAGRGIWAPAGK